MAEARDSKFYAHTFYEIYYLKCKTRSDGPHVSHVTYLNFGMAAGTVMA